MVSVAVLLEPLALAEICTLVWLPTTFVPTVNIALVAPAETVTELGIEPTAPAPLTTASVTVVS